jgi:cytochrome oxidase Cu insertion factor (SCO1/SenC/PrrC family)/thioredoxin-related protein
MSYWKRLAAVALAALLPAVAQAALFEPQPADFQAEAKVAGREGKQLAVFMTLPDCPGCLEMERTVLRDPASEKAFSRHYRGVRLDLAGTREMIDPTGRKTSISDFANRLHVFATPSFVFFNPKGEVLFRYTGTLDAAGLKQLAAYVAAGDYEKRPFTPPRRTPPHSEAGPAQLYADPPGATLPQYPEFELAGTDGRAHKMRDFRGSGVALAVGYTQCPDVCPTTLAELKAAVEALPAGQRRHVRILFVTLDPERDAISLLREYADAFRPKDGHPILGLRGSKEQTAALVRQLQLVAEKQPSASMGYTLDHTAGIFLFAATGRLLGLSPYGQPLNKLGSDLLHIASHRSPPKN